MAYILSIVADPAAPALDAAARARLERAFPQAGIVTLAEGVACEIALESKDDAHRRAMDALGGLPADINVLPREGRRKRLLVADMDSTIIEQECLDELAAFVGRKAEIAAITERAMRGELDFEAALLERIAMMRGLPERALAETFERRITLTPGARVLVATMKTLGARTVLVSGGFSYFTERVAVAAGFDAHDANTLLFENGALSGVARPIKGREAKADALRVWAEKSGCALAQTLAVGDGANDLDMLAAAGLGVAFRAKPAVAAAARARVAHGDLTALLYLQGVPQAEFAAT